MSAAITEGAVTIKIPLTRGKVAIVDLEFHPLANLFPLTEGEAFEELVRDIKENGLQNSIILWEDKILDGRNRHRAVLRILAEGHKIKLPGGETVYKNFYEQLRQYRKTSKGWTKIEPDYNNALHFVLSTNLHRRHLTDLQRAAIAADIANLAHGGDRSKSPNGGVSQSEAAKLLNTSKRSVERASRRKKLDPAAHEAAKAGKKVNRPKPEANPDPKPDFSFLTDDNFKLEDSRDIAHQVVELMCSINMSCHYYMDALDIIEDKLGKMRAGNFSDSRKRREAL